MRTKNCSEYANGPKTMYQKVFGSSGKSVIETRMQSDEHMPEEGQTHLPNSNSKQCQELAQNEIDALYAARCTLLLTGHCEPQRYACGVHLNVSESLLRREARAQLHPRTLAARGTSSAQHQLSASPTAGLPSSSRGPPGSPTAGSTW